jgi:hypothetical protein
MTMTAKDRCSSMNNICRTSSFATEVSSCVSSADSEFLDGSLRAHEISKTSFSTAGTMRSSSILELSHEELLAVSASLLPQVHSVLKVKTQLESFRSSLSSLDESSETTKVATHSHSVSFGELRIREYARRPGCNPGCRVGVSLELEWTIQDEASVALEAYEESRPPRRDRAGLNVPPEIRMRMMLESGFTRSEILQYVKMANIARGQRSRTNETHQLAKAEELAQKILRGVRNSTTRRSQKKKEKAALQQSLLQDKKLAQLRFAQLRSTTSSSPETPTATTWKRVPSFSKLELQEQAPPLAFEEEDSSASADDEDHTDVESRMMLTSEVEC